MSARRRPDRPGGASDEGIVLRAMALSDWDAVAEIYRQGIESGDATFETRVPGWEEWDAHRLPHCRVVAEEARRVVGFACLSAVSARAVYRGVAEVMVYVADDARGRGVGRRLLETLVACSQEEGIWTLQAGIFPENRASIRIHEALGFRVLGVHEALGRFHDGRWRDVVRMERRSPRVGRD